jgi:hypothetical protein
LRRSPCGEFAKQRGVSFRSVIRLPAFVAQVLQKIFDEILHVIKKMKAVRPPTR